MIAVFRFYFGIAIMCLIFAIASLLLSNIGGEIMATVFIALAGGLLAVGLITSGPKSRW